MKKKLPLGITYFTEIITKNYVYIDKTKYLYQIVSSGKYYFLSRPRRFGKSLLLSTLKEIFSANKDLFKGLWIYTSDYDWQKYPIIHLNISQSSIHTPQECQKKLYNLIKNIAYQYDIKIQTDSYEESFGELITKLYKKYNQQVVLLIDEYDNPIINNLDDIQKAKEIQRILKDFYTIIKASDEHIRFAILTGVSKFSRTGIFSALNNLTDISMDEKYCKMLGITQEELEEYFDEYIDDLCKKQNLSRDKTLEKIKYWYNGYCFNADTPKEEDRVYNPYSLILLFEKLNFRNWWFESGTPSFLMDLLKQKEYNITEMEKMRKSSILFDSYDPDHLKPEALLYQTGYLTIKEYEGEDIYVLGFPNNEVKESFLNYILEYYESVKAEDSKVYIIDIRKALEKADIEGFIDRIKIFFERIPYDISDRIKDKEQYYQSIMYCVMSLLSMQARGEIKTARGRIDLVIEVKDKVYIIEFKCNQSAKKAIEQIKERGYPNIYKSKSKKLYIVGINFSTKIKNIEEYKIESI